jgi:hypothetical protein
MKKKKEIVESVPDYVINETVLAAELSKNNVYHQIITAGVMQILEGKRLGPAMVRFFEHLKILKHD